MDSFIDFSHLSDSQLCLPLENHLTEENSRNSIYLFNQLTSRKCFARELHNTINSTVSSPNVNFCLENEMGHKPFDKLIPTGSFI